MQWVADFTWSFLLYDWLFLAYSKRIQPSTRLVFLPLWGKDTLSVFLFVFLRGSRGSLAWLITWRGSRTQSISHRHLLSWVLVACGLLRSFYLLDASVNNHSLSTGPCDSAARRFFPQASPVQYFIEDGGWKAVFVSSNLAYLCRRLQPLPSPIRTNAWRNFYGPQTNVAKVWGYVGWFLSNIPTSMNFTNVERESVGFDKLFYFETCQRVSVTLALVKDKMFVGQVKSVINP